MIHSDSYLKRLTERIGTGLSLLDSDFRNRHGQYLLAAQAPDGGYSDRLGDSDLYYTAFGLRNLAVLEGLSLEVCDRAADFFRQKLTQQASVVDFFSFLYGCLLIQTAGGPDILEGSPPDWPDRVADTLEGFHRADGGYTKSHSGNSGSTYHTFLVGLCYEMLGRSFPDPVGIARFLTERRRADGGFVEVHAMRRSGTNPTAAAVGLLQLIGSTGTELLDDSREGVTRLLLESLSDEGGIRANQRVPLADLLSTFTGVWTLDQLGNLDRLDAAAMVEYVKMLERPEGGFRGGLWDEGHDVEYTFYGLGTLALFV